MFRLRLCEAGCFDYGKFSQVRDNRERPGVRDDRRAFHGQTQIRSRREDLLLLLRVLSGKISGPSGGVFGRPSGVAGVADDQHRAREEFYGDEWSGRTGSGTLWVEGFWREGIILVNNFCLCLSDVSGSEIGGAGGLSALWDGAGAGDACGGNTGGIYLPDAS